MPIAKRKDNSLNKYKKNASKIFSLRRFPLPYTWDESFCTVISAVFYPIILSRYQTFFALRLNAIFALFNGIFNLYYIFIFIGAEAMYRKQDILSRIFQLIFGKNIDNGDSLNTSGNLQNKKAFQPFEN